VQALPKDNPFLDQGYLQTLTPEVMGRELYEARVLGNWHVSPSDDLLVRDDEVVDCFTFSDEGVDVSGRYLTWDPAYGGDDKSVVMIWRGLILEHCYRWAKMDAMDQIAEVQRLIRDHQIPAKNVAIDGIGSAALLGHFRGAVDIRANARPIAQQGFATLKDQLYYRLGQAIREKAIRFKTPEIRDNLIEEITAHRSYRTDTDQPARRTPRANIGGGGTSADARCAPTSRIPSGHAARREAQSSGGAPGGEPVRESKRDRRRDSVGVRSRVIRCGAGATVIRRIRRRDSVSVFIDS